MAKKKKVEDELIPDYRLEIIKTGPNHITKAEACSRMGSMYRNESPVEQVAYAMDSKDKGFDQIMDLVYQLDYYKKELADVRKTVIDYKAASQKIMNI